MLSAPLLQVHDLTIRFGKNTSPVVEGISFSVFPNEILAIIGESGSGKTISTLAITGLLPHSAEIRGKIQFHDLNLRTLSEHQLQQLRGHKISCIFQEPMACFNPIFPIGKQIAEARLQHFPQEKKTIKNDVIKLLHSLNFSQPEKVYQKFPHELSGGMLQRAMIAMSLVNQPELLIADEPTTALDNKSQRMVLEILKSLKNRHPLAMIFITHDLKIAHYLADRIAVMKDGHLLEIASRDAIFQNPKHPYTQQLIKSISL